MNSASYCAAPFVHIYSDSSGEYKLCCQAIGSRHAVKDFNSNTHTPFDYFLSDEMENIRDKMVAGELIEGCEKCYRYDSLGQESQRKRFNDRAKDELGFYPVDVQEVELKLRIFGNHCNLSCYMCIPYNSSTRTKELKEIDIYDSFGAGKIFDAAIELNQWRKTQNDIIKNIDKVKKIRITGGEPFLLPRHYKFLDSIPDEYARNLHIIYDTNFTTLTYKDKSIFDILERFERITFSISCDHYEDKLAWIRYPIDVYQFEKNLETVLNHPKSVSEGERITNGTYKINDLKVSVSILNAEDLYDIKRYYHNKFGLGVNFANIVVGPEMLSIKNHPRKVELIEQYKDDPAMYNVISHLYHEYDKNQWNRGIHYLETLDKHRKTNYKKLWPNIQRIDNIEVLNL